MKSKEKLNDIKKSLIWGPKFSGFWDPKMAYLAYTEVNSHVWIGFTGPGRALDAAGC
jgi:hypothetical protein